MSDIEFISYDGIYPNLCRGTLVLEINGIRYEFKNCLTSGGSYGWIHNKVTHGDWHIDFNDFPYLTDMEKKFVIMLINEKIPHGCCGGCL